MKTPTMNLPPAALEQHIAVLGKTASGKTYRMRGLVEQLLAGGKRVCVIDPKGDWWGLRLSASGKSEGFPAVIFGGEHADVPINDRSGATVGELVATGNRPCVIDLSQLGVRERTRFFMDFAAAIFRHNKAPLWLVIDEVHNFAPQGKVHDPDAGRMLHWANRLASEGRGKGLRIVMASQRPQKVHKDTLTCAETLIAMRAIHPLDREQIKDWMDGAGKPETTRQILAELANMPRGEAWVWSPEIGYLERNSSATIKTYDSMKAPEGGAVDNLKGWADVDLDDVKAKLADVVKEAEANDPKKLKARIAELEAAAKKASKPENAQDLSDEVARLTEAYAHARREVKNLRDIRTELLRAIDKVSTAVRLPDVNRCESCFAPASNDAGDGVYLCDVCAGKSPAPIPARSLVIATARSNGLVGKRFEPPNGAPPLSKMTRSDGLTARQQRFLDAAATLATLGTDVSREKVCGWLGVHPRGGSVGEELSALEQAGFIVNDRGRLTVTPEGQAAAGAIDPATAVDRARGGLSPRQTRIFDLIVAAHPGSTTRQAVADAMEIHARGGSFGNDIARLVGRGLIESDRGTLRARDFLFAGGAH